MQRSLFILLGIFLAALIVYGGSGVNTYFYCCGDCRTEGPDAVTEYKCCEIHYHHDSTIIHHEDYECNGFSGESHGECGVDRIRFDWQSSTGNHWQSEPKVITLNNSLFFYTAQATDIVVYSTPLPCSSRQSQKPPDLSKEDYFSLLTTLII